MSAELTAPRSQYKQRLSTFIDSRRGKMFGIAEVAALAGSCLVLLLVLLSYLYLVVPARLRVSSLNQDKTRLQANLQTLGGVVSKGQNTREQVDEIAASLGKFETGHLLQMDQGRMDLYEDLNQMIINNKLRNTSGPTYAPLDPAGTKSASGKTTINKWQSFYPGLAVTVTVEGQYNDIRRFVRDLERSKQFVVINQVELQRAKDNNSPADEAVSGPSGSLVSLQLSLATYFQRDNSANTNPQPQE